MPKAVRKKALGGKLLVPQKKTAQKECDCLLGADTGAYNTGEKGCMY